MTGFGNLFKLAWKSRLIKCQVSPSDEYLSLRFGISGETLIHNPFMAILTASQCHYVNSCIHDPDAELEYLEPDVYYTTPAWDPAKRKDGIGVVAVRGNEDLRFYSLVGGQPGVVRINGCLKCCLDACRSSDSFHFVVC